MQNLKEEFKEYIADTDFSDWDDDFFSQNFSDVENKLQSQHLIKNLVSSTNNRIGIESGSSYICRDVSCNRNAATPKWKEIRLSKLRTVNTSRDLIFQKEQKSNKTTCIRKHPDEHSDSEDFCAPNKKRKKTEIQSVDIFVKRDKAFTLTDVPINLLNNQIDSISVIEVPLEETSKSLSDSQESKMAISQELAVSQKEVKTAGSQSTRISSQENYSQTSLSPTVINSSQESLGNKIMKICIEDSSISNATRESGTRIDITPPITHEELKTSNMNQNVNSQKLEVCNQKSLSNDTFSSKKIKADFPEKNKFTENSVSDTPCIKNRWRYNKEQKRVIWNIRKRELEVTKRENAVEIREKLLDVQQANIQKREEILKARERKYLSYKAKIKNKLQKRGIKNKKLKKRIGVLEDDTNSFNTQTTKRFELVK